MKSSTLLIISLLALTGFMANPVQAQNPHFQSCSATGPDSSGKITVSFREVGLGTGVTAVKITASAHVDFTYACKNHGQQCPNAANKVSSGADISVSGDFPVRHGNTTGSLDIAPPPSTLRCPGNMTVVLVAVNFTGVGVSSQDGASCSVTGEFARNFFENCP
jgi:hypothetical protein